MKCKNRVKEKFEVLFFFFWKNKRILNGVRNPIEPRLKATIGGTDSWKIEVTWSTVPSPPKVIIKSIVSLRVVTNYEKWKVNLNS